MGIFKSKISVSRIQKELFKYYREKGYLYFIANSYFLGYEADMVIVTAKKFLFELEIKRSKSDYWADYKNKKQKHQALKSGKYPVNFFYFVCEPGLIDPKEVEHPYGLIYINKQNYNNLRDKRIKYKYVISVVKKAGPLHQNTIENDILIKGLNSMAFKYFNNLKTKD